MAVDNLPRNENIKIEDKPNIPDEGEGNFYCGVVEGNFFWYIVLM